MVGDWGLWFQWRAMVGDWGLWFQWRTMVGDWGLWFQCRAMLGDWGLWFQWIAMLGDWGLWFQWRAMVRDWDLWFQWRTLTGDCRILNPMKSVDRGLEVFAGSVAAIRQTRRILNDWLGDWEPGIVAAEKLTTHCRWSVIASTVVIAMEWCR